MSPRKNIVRVILACAVGGLLVLPLSAWAQPAVPNIPVVPNINNPYGAGANPYQAGGALVPNFNLQNPYTTGAIGNPYGGFGNYYYPNPFSGMADIVNSQGNFMLSQELARLQRERAFQEYLKSKKAAIELARWIRATTPSYGEKQAQRLAQTLYRIQVAATPTEIWSGKALNLMVKALAKHRDKITDTSEIPIPPDILRRLNITVRGGGNLGLLRDGTIDWPVALVNCVDETTRKDIDLYAQDLVNQARNTGKVNPNTLKDLNVKVGKLREVLRVKGKTLTVMRFLEAQRFVDDFNRATRALEKKGVAEHHFAFQDWVKQGGSKGKTMQEVINYLDGRGLIIGPSIDGDENAYEAIYSDLLRRMIRAGLNVAKKEEVKN